MSDRRYRCTAPTCQHVHPTWAARCVVCGAYHLQPLGIAAPRASSPSEPPPLPPVPVASREAEDDEITDGAGPISIADVAEETYVRESTGFTEVDKVFGDGGVVVGSVTAIFAKGGTGKSTLLQQMVAGMGQRALYATGEQTISEVAANARRVNAVTPKVMVIRESNVDLVIQHAIKVRAKILVIDSAYTLHAMDVNGRQGSPSQINACVTRVHSWAKAEGVTVFIIAHVTSDGDLAGPQAFHHLVDVVLEFRPGEGRRSTVRELVADNKNRYGATNVVGRMLMTANGLVDCPEPVYEDVSDEIKLDNGVKIEVRDKRVQVERRTTRSSSSGNLNPGDDEDPGNDEDPEVH